jgi:hypothetical protein
LKRNYIWGVGEQKRLNTNGLSYGLDDARNGLRFRAEAATVLPGKPVRFELCTCQIRSVIQTPAYTWPFPHFVKYEQIVMLCFTTRCGTRLLFSGATPVWRQSQVQYGMPRGTAVTKVSGQGALTLRDQTRDCLYCVELKSPSPQRCKEHTSTL